MIQKTTTSILIIFLIACGIWYVTLSPSIAADQVELNGVLYRSDQVTDPAFNSEWVFDLEIKNSSNVPLSDVDEEYAHIVTPYVAGFRTIGWEFPEHFADAEPHLKMNSHSDVENRVSVELQQLGWDEKAEDLNRINGFTYVGNQQIAMIRYYLIPIHDENQEPPSQNGAFAFYSHLQEKWGKDVGWMKRFPMRVENNF